MFYRTYTVVTWNYIRYHILEHGVRYYIPRLDKTTLSLSFHLWDGFLNFNIVFILALISGGCTVSVRFMFPFITKKEKKKPNSIYTFAYIRLLLHL
jgi:alpha-1,2-mannosyltransferase